MLHNHHEWVSDPGKAICVRGAEVSTVCPANLRLRLGCCDAVTGLASHGAWVLTMPSHTLAWCDSVAFARQLNLICYGCVFWLSVQRLLCWHPNHGPKSRRHLVRAPTAERTAGTEQFITMH
jgi:hypothetical protein